MSAQEDRFGALALAGLLAQFTSAGLFLAAGAVAFIGFILGGWVLAIFAIAVGLVLWPLVALAGVTLVVGTYVVVNTKFLQKFDVPRARHTSLAAATFAVLTSPIWALTMLDPDHPLPRALAVAVLPVANLVGYALIARDSRDTSRLAVGTTAGLLALIGVLGLFGASS